MIVTKHADYNMKRWSPKMEGSSGTNVKQAFCSIFLSWFQVSYLLHNLFVRYCYSMIWQRIFDIQIKATNRREIMRYALKLISKIVTIRK